MAVLPAIPLQTPVGNAPSVPEQGLKTWVGLKSRRGEPVGAVQIQVSLNRLLDQCQLDHRYSLPPCFPPPPPTPCLPPWWLPLPRLCPHDRIVDNKFACNGHHTVSGQL